jgi:hypothetical protein
MKLLNGLIKVNLGNFKRMNDDSNRSAVYDTNSLNHAVPSSTSRLQEIIFMSCTVLSDHKPTAAMIHYATLTHIKHTQYKIKLSIQSLCLLMHGAMKTYS